MRRPIAVIFVFATSSLIYSACSVSVGSGDVDGLGGFTGDGDGDGDGGEGGRSSETGDGDGDGDGDADGSGGTMNQFVPTRFVPPAGLPADLPEVVRLGGYTVDSAALRIRDAFRATYAKLNAKLTEECGWGIDGRDHFVDLEQYLGLCSAACKAEYISCDDDAELQVCDFLDSSNASSPLSACLEACESFECDDGSSDTAFRCDLNIDCDDASDEKQCGDLAFLCDDGNASVSGFAVCDGEEDCDDGSDEKDCGKNGFVCSDGSRIQGAFQCDGEEDCADGADEENCSDLVYDCGGGDLIPWYKTCDDLEQCADGSDERLGCVDLDPDMTCTY